MLKRSCKVLSLNEKFLHLRKEKKIICWGCYDLWLRMNHLWNGEGKSHASFAVTSQTAKVAATVCDKCLVKMEKAFICKDVLR